MNHSIKEAPAFYGIFAFIIFFSAGLTLIPNISLVGIMLFTQQIAGILSPVILIFMVLLTNKKELMGKYVNSGIQNIIIWTTVIFIVILSVIIFVSPLIDLFF